MKRFWRNVQLVLVNFYTSTAWRMVVGVYLLAIVGGLSLSWWEGVSAKQALVAEVADSNQTVTQLTAVADEYDKLKNDDQIKKNEQLSSEIEQIQQTFTDGAELFERRADLSAQAGFGTNKKIDVELAKFLAMLGDRDWQGAKELIITTNKLIDELVVASTPKTPAATMSNDLPGSGYSRQRVSTERGEFTVAMVVAPGARVVIETASESDCSDNCPTKTLAEHIASSGGFAGINGSYFCPPDYAQCQGRVNSFDTLAVNGRTKAVLNRANNVYSTVPLVAAYGSSLSFYDQTVQWGVDTSSTGALANHPRLLRDGSVVASDGGSKGTRGFIGVKDGAVVIGHVFSATLFEAAETLKTLGLQNALNLDGGGSSALWYEGSYKVGPGRSLPTAVVLVR